MRIALITAYLPSGSKIGVGYQTHYYANALVRRGHEVTVFSPHPKPEDALYAAEVVPVGRALRTFRFAWNLRRYDWTGFDVLHAMTDDYWLAGKRRPRHIRTLHGSCWAEAKYIPGAKAKLRMGLLAATEHISIMAADRAIANAANTLRYFPQVRDFVYCGIDTNVFRPGESKSANPSVLFVGTLRWRKRGALLLKVFQNEVRSQFPDAELWLVCEEDASGPGISVYKNIPESALVDLYQRAWVFCLPSTYEGFGVPYIEAMACGTPVVATPNAGAVEVLESGKCGVLARPEQLGASICRLLSDPEERRQWGLRGVERAQQFDWSHAVDAYERIYAGAPLTAPRGKGATRARG